MMVGVIGGNSPSWGGIGSRMQSGARASSYRRRAKCTNQHARQPPAIKQLVFFSIIITKNDNFEESWTTLTLNARSRCSAL